MVSMCGPVDPRSWRELSTQGGSVESRQGCAGEGSSSVQFEYEILVDTSKIDSEIALATAFVSMLTQWGMGEFTKPVEEPDDDSGAFPTEDKPSV